AGSDGIARRRGDARRGRGPRGGPPAAAGPGAWPTVDGDYAAARYSPLDEITTENVSALEELWSYTLGGASTAVPLAVDGIVYVPSGDRVVALDGDTGEEVWVHVLRAPSAPERETASASPVPMRGARASNRGVSYWPGDAEHGPRILFTSGSRLVALDAATGEPAAASSAT